MPDVERFSRLMLAVDAFRKKDYSDAENWLKLAVESDLDRLITGLMTGWAKAGQGDTDDALKYLEELQGPEWYGIFTTYHRALIAEQAGLDDKADRSLPGLARRRRGRRRRARDLAALGRILCALPGAQGREGQGARRPRPHRRVRGRPRSRHVLRKEIEAGKPVSRLVDGPVDGASEVLLDLGGALNRSGGEAFVKLYLQLARALEPNSDAVLLQLASVAEQQNDSEEAIDLYARIPADSPMKRVAELQRGLNLADLDRHDEAIAQLTKLLDEDPDDMRAYLALGGVYASKEDFRNAADVYDKAVGRLKILGRRRLEHLLSARHRL